VEVKNTASPTVLPPQQTQPPRLEIGIALGADKGIGIDPIVDCKKPIYTCLSADQIGRQPLVFDVGTKGWGRIILRVKNVGDQRLLHPVTHIESSQPISIDYAANPNPERLPRNVLDITGDDISPFSLSEAEVAIPIDVTVLPDTMRFDLDLNIFGDNMKAHKVTFHFDIARAEAGSSAITDKSSNKNTGQTPTKKKTDRPAENNAGNIIQGPGSIAQIGNNNQASIVSGPPDRTLSVSQKDAIAGAAKSIPSDIRVVVEHPTDYESSVYAKMIHDALAEFRSADLGTALSYGGQPPPVGLYVLAHTDDDKVIPYANQLFDAMKKSGIPCEGYQVDWVPSGTLRISVGIKPRG
jgi:hypothetical protein